MTKRSLTVALAGALSALVMAFVAVAQAGPAVPERLAAALIDTSVAIADVAERPCSARGHDHGRSRHTCHHMVRPALAGSLSRPARKIDPLAVGAVPSVATVRVADAGVRLAPPRPTGQRLASAAGYGPIYAVTRRLHI